MNEKPVLEHFNYCPSCGSRRVGIEDAKRVFCPDCSFTLYQNPSCSAAALIFDGVGRLLVIERAHEPSKGKYAIPGGFTDHGERLEEVVIRETKEEVNLDLDTVTFFASFPNTYRFRQVAYAVTDVYFLAEARSFAGIAAEEKEVAGIHFIDPREVPSDQWAFDSLRNAIAKYLSER